jgi:hypothetical protein
MDALRFGLNVERVQQTAGRLHRHTVPLNVFLNRSDDPMQISFHVSEIANGVLAWTSHGYQEGTEGEKTFFPNLTEAYAAAATMLASAHARWIQHRAALKSSQDFAKEAVAHAEREYARSERLPEEEAAMNAGVEMNTYNSPVDDDEDAAVYHPAPSSGFVIGGEQRDFGDETTAAD